MQRACSHTHAKRHQCLMTHLMQVGSLPSNNRKKLYEFKEGDIVRWTRHNSHKVTVRKMVKKKEEEKAACSPCRVPAYLSSIARSAPPRLRKLPHHASKRLTRRAFSGTL